MEIPQKLKEYIDNNRGSLPSVADPDEPLQIHSLDLIRLVEDEELVAENFTTLRKLGELHVQRRSFTTCNRRKISQYTLCPV